jgi:hypothetical protein
MLALDFERGLEGSIGLDFCFPCQVIWFDQHESPELSPGGVLGVFKALNEHRTEARNTLSGLLDCPRCNARLTLTQDLQHTTRFSYYRCEFGHGRLTPFLQFLREKNFIRPLSGAELVTLKAKVRTIQCSNCGAPVDLEHDIACAYCHTPISILDPDAIAKTVSELTAAETHRQTIDVDALADALLQRAPSDTGSPQIGALLTGDLVAVGIGIIAKLLR